MSPEEYERSLEFLVRQQATFDARMAQLAARQEELATAQERDRATAALMRDALVGTMGLVQKLTEAQLATDRRLDALTERVDTVTGRLDAFIVIVERYITRNGNGHKPQ
ncbi:MAG: hypothetical protein ACRD01_06150 [Terriglobales bacterium]